MLIPIACNSSCCLERCCFRVIGAREPTCSTDFDNTTVSCAVQGRIASVVAVALLAKAIYVLIRLCVTVAVAPSRCAVLPAAANRNYPQRRGVCVNYGVCLS